MHLFFRPEEKDGKGSYLFLLIIANICFSDESNRDNNLITISSSTDWCKFKYDFTLLLLSYLINANQRCLPAAEAMSMALPVLVPNHTGFQAFATKKNAYLIKVVPRKFDNLGFAVVSVKSLAQIMRTVVSDSMTPDFSKPNIGEAKDKDHSGPYRRSLKPANRQKKGKNKNKSVAPAVTSELSPLYGLQTPLGVHGFNSVNISIARRKGFLARKNMIALSPRFVVRYDLLATI